MEEKAIKCNFYDTAHPQWSKLDLKKTFSFHYDGWKWSWNNNNCPVAQSFSYQRLLVYHQVAACCNLLHNLSLSWHSGWWRPIGDLLDQGRSACFEVSLTFSVWLGEDKHVAGNGTNAWKGVEGCWACLLALLKSRHIVSQCSSEMTLEQECWKTSSTRALLSGSWFMTSH